MIERIVTHPGSAHKDDFLACAVLLSRHPVPIERREPEPADLADPATCVVDVGHLHEPERNNFDHHQFPADHPPQCALSLVLQHLKLYDDGRAFCDWLETTERFDTKGPRDVGEWLGVSREAMARLNSPLDILIIRQFAQSNHHAPGNALYEVMRQLGTDLVTFLTSLRERIHWLGDVSTFWEIDDLEILYIPRTEPAPGDPSMGIARYLAEVHAEDRVAGLVYPDRRGTGFALTRFNDDPRLDFTRIGDEADVHFAHNRGFVAKTTATEAPRLRELVAMARVS